MKKVVLSLFALTGLALVACNNAQDSKQMNSNGNMQNGKKQMDKKCDSRCGCPSNCECKNDYHYGK